MKAWSRYQNYIVVCFAFLAAIVPIYMFSGFYPTAVNHYNSYSLQAVSWLSGRLDLPENYGHLEIAIFEGRYYISFPPFPSIVMLPFVVIFGAKTPDHWIALGFGMLSVVYAFRIAKQFLKDEMRAVFVSLFLCAGSNYLHVAVWGSVWYLAQSMAFALMMLSIYYAVSEKTSHSTWSLLFLAGALGCRPLNAVYLPLVALLLYKRWAAESPEERRLFSPAFIRTFLLWSIPAVALGGFYMMLNTLRFGSVFEFGHNYLPEFVEAQDGQFAAVYMPQNLHRIFLRMPAFNAEQRLEFPWFDGVAFWLVSPIVLAYAPYAIHSIFRKREDARVTVDTVIACLIPVMVFVQLLLLSAHKTMGGHHFGNRYTVDCLPVVFLGLLIATPKEKDKALGFQLPLVMLGYVINLIGSIEYYLPY